MVKLNQCHMILQEIIQIWWFDAPETFLLIIIINVENSQYLIEDNCYIFVETMIFFSDFIGK